MNPGNISDPEHIAKVVHAAKEREVPIRIGVNAGSLPKSSKKKASVVERMVDAALDEVRLLESLDFDLIKVSLKAFDVPTTVEAYEAIAKKIPYPLHLGITEAGLALERGYPQRRGVGYIALRGHRGYHQGVADHRRCLPGG